MLSGCKLAREAAAQCKPYSPEKSLFLCYLYHISCHIIYLRDTCTLYTYEAEGRQCARYKFLYKSDVIDRKSSEQVLALHCCYMYDTSSLYHAFVHILKPLRSGG